jgi:protection of telomeres protein 1
VKCNHPDKTPTPLATILNDTTIVRSTSGSEFILPFENIKHRSNVRVVDFWPNRLEDFAVAHRVSEYEVLSDYSGGESTDNEEDMRLFREGKGYGGEKAWEWRFALRVQDADKKAKSHKDTMWLIVDNQAGQMLLKMDAVKWVIRVIERSCTDYTTAFDKKRRRSQCFEKSSSDYGAI